MDTVQRFLFEDLDVRGTLVRLGPAWRAMQERRNYGLPECRLLGELAAATTLIGGNLKQPGRISFQLQGSGPVRLLVMDCDEQLRIRGVARAGATTASATVPQLIGDGRLALTLRGDNINVPPYVSHVPVEGDTLAEMLEHYLQRSEQTPTRLWLAADTDCACGLFLQRLPEVATSDADGWNRVQHLAATVRGSELTLPAETLLGRLFPEETLRLFEPRPVRYHCPRDDEKVLNMLRTLGREEVAAMLAEREEIVIQDDICNHEYRFGPDILHHLFPDPSRMLH